MALGATRYARLRQTTRAPRAGTSVIARRLFHSPRG
jgi:hypothetical protein